MKALLLLISLYTFIPAANLKGIKGKVVGVTGGNAIEILSEGKVMAVKIYGIDCPAKSFAKGKVARHFVADKAFMSDVELEIISVESDGTLIGKVVLQDGKNLGVEMLKGGLAWWDKRATPGEKALAKVEAEARDAYMGIWAGASEDDEDNDWGKEVLAAREKMDRNDLAARTTVTQFALVNSVP